MTRVPSGPGSDTLANGDRDLQFPQTCACARSDVSSRGSGQIYARACPGEPECPKREIKTIGQSDLVCCDGYAIVAQTTSGRPSRNTIVKNRSAEAPSFLQKDDPGSFFLRSARAPPRVGPIERALGNVLALIGCVMCALDSSSLDLFS